MAITPSKPIVERGLRQPATFGRVESGPAEQGSAGSQCRGDPGPEARREEEPEDLEGAMAELLIDLEEERGVVRAQGRQGPTGRRAAQGRIGVG
ncbi:MAG: hypothetical protein WKF83_07645 [Nocardioidaceae bacterium]